VLKPFADAHSTYRVIEPALRAPSVYNTQPWSFRIVADDRVELRAKVDGGDGPGCGRWDLLLHSPAPGPWPREYAISCGAALMNLRLAFRVLGHDPVITLVPEPAGDPGLLASVGIGVGRTHKPSSLEQELYDAIGERHTDRWPFSDTPLQAGILVEMECAAAQEHGWLRILHGTFARRWLNGPRERYERHPQLLMLFTNRDEPADWLRAGQALQRALLTATSLGASASFLTQPLEIADLEFRYDPRYRRPPGLTGHPGLSVHRYVDASQRNSTSPMDRRGYARRHLLGATPWLEVPQMVIRVGYPTNQAGKDLRTPRQEPEITDARCDPPVRLAWPPAGSPSPARSPYPAG
jgi:hypothetical protein